MAKQGTLAKDRGGKGVASAANHNRVGVASQMNNRTNIKDDSIPAPLTDALKSTLAKKASQIMDHDKHHNRSRLPNDQLGSLMQSERL